MTLETPDGDGIAEVALRYAWHGWPIIPGTEPSPRRGNGWPVPLAAALPYRGPMSTNDVVRYWHHRPHPVLLAAGLTVDVLEMCRAAATRLLHDLPHRGAVAVLPNGRWCFFIDTGQSPPRELLSRNMRYHGAATWVPLPPTRIGRRQMSWHIDPASIGWRLFPRDWLNGVLRPAPPRRPSPRRLQAQPTNLTLLVASDHPTFEVTHLIRETA